MGEGVPGGSMSISTLRDSDPRRAGKRRRATEFGPVGYKVDEVAVLLRISRNAAYDMVERGEIPCVRLGRLIRVPVGAFHQKFGDFISP
jgi:excisionase family DNA binding protein